MARKTKSQYKKEYNQLQPTYSPALKATIHFNARGFHHITHGGKKKSRKTSEQFLKLKYMPVYHQVIAECPKVIEVRTRNILVKRKNKIGIFYELKHTTDMGTVSIIVRKIKGSNKHIFWSVIPGHKRNKNKKRPQ